jgi:hypothetical protein
MTWAADRPHGARWSQSEASAAPASRAVVRSVGTPIVGFLSVIVAAWGALSVFWGPDFGYRPTSAAAWDWTMRNWLLHAVPGAVGAVAGLLIIVTAPRVRAGAQSVLIIPALLLVGAGVWFVIGPAVWRTFESAAPFVTGVSASRSLLNQFGSSLGPGLLLAIFGGMALKAGTARPVVAVDTPAVDTPAVYDPVVPGDTGATPTVGP